MHKGDGYLSQYYKEEDEEIQLLREMELSAFKYGWRKQSSSTTAQKKTHPIFSLDSTSFEEKGPVPPLNTEIRKVASISLNPGV